MSFAFVRYLSFKLFFASILCTALFDTGAKSNYMSYDLAIKIGPALEEGVGFVISPLSILPKKCCCFYVLKINNVSLVRSLRFIPDLQQLKMLTIYFLILYLNTLSTFKVFMLIALCCIVIKDVIKARYY